MARFLPLHFDLRQTISHGTERQTDRQTVRHRQTQTERGKQREREKFPVLGLRSTLLTVNAKADWWVGRGRGSRDGVTLTGIEEEEKLVVKSLSTCTNLAAR